MKVILKSLTVWVVALGYFVDIFDITLFGMLRVQSLKDLGVSADNLLVTGQMLLNFQMMGMLLGGFLFGILGDKKGRLGSLFASIILYSLGNLANAFVHSVDAYAMCRFISGVGLAGELGLGVTLVVEILSKEDRGLGTAFIATVGVLGAVIAGLVVETVSWRHCYIIGAVLGFSLLLLRIKVQESKMFNSLHNQSNVSKGSLIQLFSSKDRLRKYFLCILIGVPIWFVAGIIMTLSPELGVALKVPEPILASRSIAISYLGLAAGDLISGVLSQMLKSRKKILFGFEIFTIIAIAILFLTAEGKSQIYFYFMCFLIGLGAGFWALFVTVSAEQFGTNLRATVATTVPNLVRASLILMNGYLLFLKNYFDILTATLITGGTVFILCLSATALIKETFGKELNYLE